ncbi:MAG TPA: hypothetical protein VD905_21990, partial [Flavobacteriales bacterium]|nr:hypothetical protein [Flavobacteriales bacterium]
MIKKLNTWLLRNHPLLWNTKVVWATFVLILLHGMFYLSGRLSFHSLEHINRHGHHFYNYGRDTFSIFLLIVFLFLLVWTLSYFQNNAFKSFYPVNRWYLMKEFLVCFFICYGACTIYSSYEKGYTHAILNYTHTFDLRKDAQTLNLAACFLPFNKGDFEKRQSCDSIDARSFNAAMTDDRDTDYYGEGAPCDQPAQPADYAQEPAKTPKPYSETYSYLYYCRNYTFEAEGYGRSQINKAHTWLRQKNKTAIFNALNAFKAMCARYEVKENIDAAFFANACFADSLHTVYYTVEPRAYYNTDGSNIDYFADAENIVQSIQMIEHERSTHYVGTPEFFAALYAALGIVLFIFSFRITGLRIWLVAL